MTPIYLYLGELLISRYKLKIQDYVRKHEHIHAVCVFNVVWSLLSEPVGMQPIGLELVKTVRQSSRYGTGRACATAASSTASSRPNTESQRPP